MTTPPNSQKQTALITGASGGIGEELTKLFARDGYNLVLVARSGVKLKQFGDALNDEVRRFGKTIAKDLSSPTSPEEVFAEVEKEGIQVDVLVNNAGFAMYGMFNELDGDTEAQMMQVNMVTLTRLTRLFLPGMIERHNGKILNVASTAAFQPGPLMAVYYAPNPMCYLYLRLWRTS